MKALKTGFAKWVGALAIATLAPLAQAIPVGSFLTPGINLGALDLSQGSTLSVEVSGFVPGLDYRFQFVAVGPTGFNIGDLSVSFADFGPAAGVLEGDFTASFGTETWLFEVTGLGIPDQEVSINLAQIFCLGNPVECSGSTNNVPEPGTLMLVGAALLAGAAIRRRKPV